MGDSSGDEVDDLVYGMNDDDAAGNRNGVVSDALSRGMTKSKIRKIYLTIYTSNRQGGLV